MPKRLSQWHPDAWVALNPYPAASYSALEQVMGRVILAWPYVEAELAVSLVKLLALEADAGVTMYNAIKGPAQRAALRDVANLRLTGDDQSLFRELLDRVDDVAKKRGKVAHGLWAYSQYDDGMLLVPPKLYPKWHGPVWPSWRTEPVMLLRTIDRSEIEVYDAQDFREIGKLPRQVDTA